MRVGGSGGGGRGGGGAGEGGLSASQNPGRLPYGGSGLRMTSNS